MMLSSRNLVGTNMMTYSWLEKIVCYCNRSHKIQCKKKNSWGLAEHTVAYYIPNDNGLIMCALIFKYWPLFWNMGKNARICQKYTCCLKCQHTGQTSKLLTARWEILISFDIKHGSVCIIAREWEFCGLYVLLNLQHRLLDYWTLSPWQPLCTHFAKVTIRPVIGACTTF